MIKLLSNYLKKTVLILGIVCFISSCSGRPDGVLNQHDMTEILFEMHKLEGTFAEKSDSIKTIKDKTPYYKAILAKHNITQADFDSSIVWYSKYPKKYERIYDNVIVKLEKLDSDVKSRKYHPVDSVALKHLQIQLWDSVSHFTFTKDSTRNKLAFKIIDTTLQYQDKYILTFLQRITPEDSCTEQHIVLRINYANGSVDSVYQVTYNDSLLRRYYIKLPAFQKQIISSISGELLGSKEYKGNFNSTTDSISLIREYNSLLQESIYKLVRQKDTIKSDSTKSNRIDSIKRVKNSINYSTDKIK